MGEPAVQASYMKQFAAQVRELGADGERVVASDPELFAELDEAWRMTWLPIETNVRMVDALYGTLGTARTRTFLADQIGAQLDTPLWRSFVEGAVRLLGLDPGSLSRWLPQTLALVFRSCGSWNVGREGEAAAVLRGENVPRVLVVHPHWADSVAAGLHALFSLCKTSGEAHVEERDPQTGLIRISLRWKPAG